MAPTQTGRREEPGCLLTTMLTGKSERKMTPRLTGRLTERLAHAKVETKTNRKTDTKVDRKADAEAWLTEAARTRWRGELPSQQQAADRTIPPAAVPPACAACSRPLGALDLRWKGAESGVSVTPAWEPVGRSPPRAPGSTAACFEAERAPSPGPRWPKPRRPLSCHTPWRCEAKRVT